MKDDDQSVEINHNTNQPYIPDHPYGILIIDGSGSGKSSVLLNLIKDHRPDIDKIHVNVKGAIESTNYLLKTLKNLLIIHKQLIIFMKI